MEKSVNIIPLYKSLYKRIKEKHEGYTYKSHRDRIAIENHLDRLSVYKDDYIECWCSEDDSGIEFLSLTADEFFKFNNDIYIKAPHLLTWHRNNAPAVTSIEKSPDGENMVIVEYWNNDNRHRWDGAAFLYYEQTSNKPDGLLLKTETWWINGTNYTYEEIETMYKGYGIDPKNVTADDKVFLEIAIGTKK